MLCLSFGYYIAIVILSVIVSLFLPSFMSPVVWIAQAGLFSYWVAGFFLKCDGYLFY